MIEIDRISKSYGTVEALKEVSLSVAKGEFVSLLGPSGSGKTTLLNLIAGMIQPSNGRIIIDGTDITQLPPSKRGLGMVFQNYALMPHMTVFDNIAFPLRVRRVPMPEIRRRVQEVLELVRMPHVAERKPKELSGGQQQRISLARCIVYRPALILMDEPLGALDKKLRQEMQIEISRLHRDLGITMLYVTHDQEEALTMSDRIVLMKEGRCAQVGTCDELYFAPNSPYVADFIGESNLLPVKLSEPALGTVTAGLCGVSRNVPPPDFPVRPGQDAVMLVRPEMASLTFKPGPEGALHGRLETSLIVGGSLRHVVQLDDGSTFLVQEVNHRERARGEPGAEVWVDWPDTASRLLQPQ